MSRPAALSHHRRMVILALVLVPAFVPLFVDLARWPSRDYRWLFPLIVHAVQTAGCLVVLTVLAGAAIAAGRIALNWLERRGSIRGSA